MAYHPQTKVHANDLLRWLSPYYDNMWQEAGRMGHLCATAKVCVKRPRASFYEIEAFWRGAIATILRFDNFLMPLRCNGLTPQ